MPAVPVAEPLSRHPDAWRAATRHTLLDAADVGTALTALWTIGRTHLDAWSGARPGAAEYRASVEHRTVPGSAGYVAGLEAAADGVPAPDADAGFVEVAAAEAASRDMAVAA